MSRLKVKNSFEVVEVQNVYCVGKNYLDHIREIDKSQQNVSLPEEPIIFLKPNTSVVSASESVNVPRFKGKYISNDLQNEVELVVVIGKDGIDVPVEKAMSFVFGYAVGIDFTLRDVQSEMKKKGLPWTISKGFLTSAPVSEIVPKEDVPGPQSLLLTLAVNNEMKQRESSSKMIFSIEYIIHFISTIFGLRKGDLIFTGTPSGVTKLNRGDVVKAAIENIGELIVIFR